MRVERCACGGSIEAKDLDASARAVREHNRTKKHVLWRMSGGLEHLVETPALVLFMHAVEQGIRQERVRFSGKSLVTPFSYVKPRLSKRASR